MSHALKKNFDGLLSKINRRTETIKGDGFCFLSSIMKFMEVDHAIDLKIQEVKDLVVEQACEFHDKYVEFHASTQKRVPHYMSTVDNFITKILDFFKIGQFVIVIWVINSFFQIFRRIAHFS